FLQFLLPAEGPMNERLFKRSLNSLEAVFDFIEEFLSRDGIAGKTALELQLAVEEVFANSVEHNSGSTGSIAIALEKRGEAVLIRILDYDVEDFDVSRPPNVDTRAPLEERRAGGLGLHLIHTLMDQVRYTHKNRISTITLVKYIK
ncbi:MAG TPA: ATP-binding protein, partial [bacterium]|nr:ATP-binding protein [bacterium]